MTEIAGKAAVVTGGGSGIGMGLVTELARRGVSVAIADILADNARTVADEINAGGGTAVALHCDVCDRSSIEQMKAEANDALGAIQLVFANAGATSFVPVAELDERELDWMTAVNLSGVVWTALTFLPDMIDAGGGHITATASMAGLIPSLVPIHSAYSAAKLGVIGFMQNMQLEVAEHDVVTTIYCPGGVINGMRDNNAKYRPERFGGPSDEQMQIPHASFKDNRLTFLTPADVAPIVLRAVERNRPFVFDHAEQRDSFRQHYADVVEACFDDIDAWEHEHGRDEEGADMSADATDDVWKVLATARSIRRFTDEPVDDATLGRCLEAATWAPSGGNAQHWRFIVLDSPEMRAVVQRAADLALQVIEPVYGMTRPAPDDDSRSARRNRATYELHDTAGQRTSVLFVAYHNEFATDFLQGASIFPAVQNFYLAARAQGLGACFTSWAAYDGEQLLREAIGIPDRWVLAGHVVVGWPRGHHGPVRRRPLSDVVFHNAWDPDRADIIYGHGARPEPKT